MNQESKLNFTSDFKGLMLLFVILGHSSIIYAGFWQAFQAAVESQFFSLATRWLDSFHTYAFVFISGFIFYNLKFEVEKYQDDRIIVIKKIKRLFVPYIITCLFWAIPIHYIVFGHSFHEIFKKYILAIYPDQLWFLLMLFWVFIFTLQINRFYDFKTDRTLSEILLLGGCFALYIVAIAGNAFGVFSYFKVLSAMQYEMYFVAGMFACKHYPVIYNRIISLKKSAICCLLALLLFLSLSISFYAPLFGRVLKYIIAPIGTCSAIFFWAILINIIKRFRKGKNVSRGDIGIKIWNKYKENSFTIYLVHQQVIYIVLRYSNRPGIPPVLVVTINFISAILISAVICGVLNLIKREYQCRIRGKRIAIK